MSATDFAGMTGVARERLRTWERRHGFPAPLRNGGGPRRYLLDDVGRVVAIRRAVEAGIPLPTAITSTEGTAGEPISDAARAALAEHAPVPVVALSGPEPLRVAYVNAAVRARQQTIEVGDDLVLRAPWFAEQAGAKTLRRLFTTEMIAASCEHPDWLGELRPGAHSIAYRLPQEAGAPPLVALIGIDTGRERRLRDLLAEAERERESLRERTERDHRFGEAAAAIADLFRLQGGAAALGDAAGVLARRLGAVDAALAPYMTGALVLGRSARGLVGPEMVTVSRFDDLGEMMREGRTDWVGVGSSAALGTPSGLALMLVPILVAGETLGALLLLFDEPFALDDAQRRLLRVTSAIVGFALVRERVAGELRDPE